MKNNKHCECCGAKLVEYKHLLNQGLVQALHQLSLSKEPIPLTDLALSRNQWTNFQKLRYWGLVAKEVTSDGYGTGKWFVTVIGRDFIEGNTPMPKNAWTFRGETIRIDGDKVWFQDSFNDNYRKRKDYAEDCKAIAL
jgi:hypothetical protein